jgi:hypothetical protein
MDEFRRIIPIDGVGSPPTPPIVDPNTDVLD